MKILPTRSDHNRALLPQRVVHLSLRYPALMKFKQTNIFYKLNNNCQICFTMNKNKLLYKISLYGWSVYDGMGEKLNICIKCCFCWIHQTKSTCSLPSSVCGVYRSKYSVACWPLIGCWVAWEPKYFLVPRSLGSRWLDRDRGNARIVSFPQATSLWQPVWPGEVWLEIRQHGRPVHQARSKQEVKIWFWWWSPQCPSTLMRCASSATPTVRVLSSVTATDWGTPLVWSPVLSSAPSSVPRYCIVVVCN